MQSGPDDSNVFHRVAHGTNGLALDLFGTTVEFIDGPGDEDGDFCVLRGVVLPGSAVPLHSHDDDEDFLILAGTQQVLTSTARGLEWADARAGDYVRLPGRTLHAHRNVSAEPAIDLIITTARLGRFFREVGRPVTGSLPPPGPEEVARFVEVARKYGYVLGTPEENAAVGITMPVFAANE